MIRLRLATRGDIACFERIDEAADGMFPVGRLPEFEVEVPWQDYLPSLEAGWLRVAEAEDVLVGYIWCVVHADVLHLQQISVHPDQGRRGIGRRLLEHVIRAAAERGIRSLTLTTFADIAWNAPFYRSAGFEDLPAEGLYPHVDEALQRERALGMTRRIGMIRDLKADALMLAHAEAMYVHDAQGRIVSINDWMRRPAPLFWMGRTTSSWIWRLHSDLAVDQCVDLEEALNGFRWPGLEAGLEPTAGQTAILRLLEERGIAGEVYSGPTFLCGDAAVSVRTPRFPTTGITVSNLDLLRHGLEDWSADVEHQQPFVVSLERDQAVAVCASVRISSRAHAAGVETLPGFRRRGHATNAVAGWAAKVQATGALAMYSTSWNNTASRTVAARMGMIEFGWELRVG